MTAKIGDITLATTAAPDDLIEMERAADGLSRRISKVNFMGGTFTGGGSLATGGFTLTLPATGTAALKSGSPTIGRMAQWADANTIENSTLVKTGAGVLTLSAASAFTLTVPATGAAALLGIANVFTADQRVNALVGVNVAPVAQLDVVSGAASRSAFRFDTAASPTAPLGILRRNGVNIGAFFSNFAMNNFVNNNVLYTEAFDNGTDVGRRTIMNRNNSATTPAAGHYSAINLNGTHYRIWPDASGILRIFDSEPTNANDVSGTVVGSQSSWIGLKEDVKPWDGDDALQTVLETPLYSYQLRDDAGNPGRVYRGLVIENRDEWFATNCRENQTPALDERSLFGYLIASIQALNKRIAELEAKD